MKTLVLALATSLVLISCGSASEPTPPAAPGPDSPDGPVTSSPDPGGRDQGPKGGALKVQPRDGLVDVRPYPFHKAKVTGPRTVLVYFWSGVEECYGLSDVEVEYGSKVVVITLHEGRVPEAEMCIEIAQKKVVKVQLDEPLAGRRIVDGAS